MQTETQKQSEPQFKKANADIVKLKSGESIIGTYTGQITGPWLDKTTGEEKDLTRLFFTKQNGEKIILFEDGGLRNAMMNANVKENMLVKIEKLEKAPLHGGRSVNQYDIYIAE